MNKELFENSINVIPVENVVARKFISLFTDSELKEVKSSLISLGLYLGSELLGIAQFCSPQDQDKKQIYTIELISLIIKSESLKLEGANKLLDFYKVKYHPSDIFAYQDSKLINLELNRTGFKSSGNKNVLEWINPSVTFYTYKTTSSESDKYYYGVSHVKKANASVEDCLAHKYYGSGRKGDKRNKFHNWKLKYRRSLRKEILGIYSRKAVAYREERELIGSLWSDDHLCLNSIAGGSHGGIALETERITLRQCDIHGKSKHIGASCYPCLHKSMNSKLTCPTHGLSSHRGDVCLSCMKDENITIKNCATHGETKHYGNKCCSCHNEDSIKIKICSIHGSCKFIGEQCYRCISFSATKMKECKVHGESKHSGNKCLKCKAKDTNNIQECPDHGLTKHRGKTCLTCASSSSFTLKECLTHGLTKHAGKSCKRCSAMKRAHNLHHSKKPNLTCPDCS